MRRLIGGLVVAGLTGGLVAWCVAGDSGKGVEDHLAAIEARVGKLEARLKADVRPDGQNSAPTPLPPRPTPLPPAGGSDVSAPMSPGPSEGQVPHSLEGLLARIPAGLVPLQATDWSDLEFQKVTAWLRANVDAPEGRRSSPRFRVQMALRVQGMQAPRLTSLKGVEAKYRVSGSGWFPVVEAFGVRWRGATGPSLLDLHYQDFDFDDLSEADALTLARLPKGTVVEVEGGLRALRLLLESRDSNQPKAYRYALYLAGTPLALRREDLTKPR